jgi:photosystem I subunit 11
MVGILTFAISLYGNSNPPQPHVTVTTPNPPDAFRASEGWNTYASGFLIGGVGGAVFAYFVLNNIEVLQRLVPNLG